MKQKINKISFSHLSIGLISLLLTVTGCIDNDVQYPYTLGSIEAFDVEGSRVYGTNNAVTIYKNLRTIQAYVSDTVDIEKLKVTRLRVTNDACIYPDADKCVNSDLFPEKEFASLDSISSDADTRINFSEPVHFLLRTYQDYDWTITVTQIFERSVIFKGIQQMDAIFDEKNKQVIVYVAEGTDLTNLEVQRMQLGSSIATTIPEPSSVRDFSHAVQFEVTAFGRTETWTVNVLLTQDIQTEATIYPRTKQAIVMGGVLSGTNMVVEYKTRNESTWTQLNESSIEFNGNSYIATLRGLEPSTAYNCRIVVNGEEGKIYDFSTASAGILPNASFDEWSTEPGKDNLLNPWALDGEQYWDTGNKGATSIGTMGSNTIPTDDTATGTGQAAMLESKHIMVKFAAGNIFTGKYLRTDATDGVLSFGRPFTSFPTKLRLQYKYNSTPIDRTHENYPEYAHLVGQPDSCLIYIALTDWDEPREIRTKPSDRQLFDVNDPGIIAYKEFISSQNISSYQPLELEFEYRNYRTPKYLVIVATSSRYADYFTGGVGSTLWLDELELIYD